MGIFYISQNPEFYGSEATKEVISRWARRIAKKVGAEYPDVTFKIGDERHDMDEDKADKIQQYINDNWVDWVFKIDRGLLIQAIKNAQSLSYMESEIQDEHYYDVRFYPDEHKLFCIRAVPHKTFKDGGGIVIVNAVDIDKNPEEIADEALSWMKELASIQI